MSIDVRAGRAGNASAVDNTQKLAKIEKNTMHHDDLMKYLGLFFITSTWPVVSVVNVRCATASRSFYLETSVHGHVAERLHQPIGSRLLILTSDLWFLGSGCTLHLLRVLQQPSLVSYPFHLLVSLPWPASSSPLSSLTWRQRTI